jgi:hypothetical protein
MSEDELKAFERWTTTSDGANPCDDVEAGARHVTALVAEVRRLRTELALAQASDERAELRLDNVRLRGLVMRAGARGCESCPWCQTINNRNYRAHSDCEAFTESGEVR